MYSLLHTHTYTHSLNSQMHATGIHGYPCQFPQCGFLGAEVGGGKLERVFMQMSKWFFSAIKKREDPQRLSSYVVPEAAAVSG